MNGGYRTYGQSSEPLCQPPMSALANPVQTRCNWRGCKGNDWPHCDAITRRWPPYPGDASGCGWCRQRGGHRAERAAKTGDPVIDAHVCPLSRCRIVLLAMSHTITVESHDADASPPIESNATLVTGARCPSSTATQAPDPAFQSRTVKSAAQLANRVPSKLYLT